MQQIFTNKNSTYYFTNLHEKICMALRGCIPQYICIICICIFASTTKQYLPIFQLFLRNYNHFGQLQYTNFALFYSYTYYEQIMCEWMAQCEQCSFLSLLKDKLLLVMSVANLLYYDTVEESWQVFLIKIMFLNLRLRLII